MIMGLEGGKSAGHGESYRWGGRSHATLHERALSFDSMQVSTCTGRMGAF